MRKRRLFSIRNQFTLMLLLGVAFSVLFAFSCLWMPQQIISRQVSNINTQMLSIYMGYLDEALSDIRETVLVLAVNNPSLTQLGEPADELKRYTQKVEVQNRLRDEISVNRRINGLFTYSVTSGIYLDRYRDEVTYPERKAIETHLMQSLSGELPAADFTGRWHAATIGGKTQLMCLFSYENQIVGSALDVHRLYQETLGPGIIDDGYLVLLDADGAVLVGDPQLPHLMDLSGVSGREWIPDGAGETYLAIEQTSQTTGLRLLALHPRHALLGGFRTLVDVLTVICITALLALFILFSVMRRMTLKPIEALVSGMRRIGDGALDHKIQLSTRYAEIQLLGDTFNSMSDELTRLRRDIYEKRITEQKLALQYRQVQIRPHFLYNTLNIACTLIQMEQYAQASALCASLIKHFRYMLHDGNVLVRLEEELAHARNYFSIQGMRFPGSIQIQYDIDPRALDCRLPPLLVHTLLENAAKHALTAGETLFVTLSVFLRNEKGDECLYIRVWDTGPGFSSEALDRLGQEPDDEPLAEAFGAHIGLANARQRLRLTYGDRASIQFYNLPDGGACNEIGLPCGVEEVGFA